MSITTTSLILLSGSESLPAIRVNNTTGFYLESKGLSYSLDASKVLTLNDGVEFKRTSEADVTYNTTGYGKLFVDDAGIVKTVNFANVALGTSAFKVVGSTPTTLPNNSFSNFTLYGLQLYIGLISGQDNLTINSYTTGATAVVNAYIGGVYSITQNRIYLIPYGQANQAQWHYINCATGNIVAYTHGATVVQFGYLGGVYSPTQDRIYFVPYAQANQTNWHYINCATGAVVAYANGVTAQPFAYNGGCYSPTQNRIYFAPYAQGPQLNTWHYINCATGNVVTYSTGATVVSGGYAGAVYSPNQNRIYFVPFAQANQANWHYVNCANGSIVAYANTSGTTPVSQAYWGGAYSPTQNRIYFAPYTQSNQTRWHFIDCNRAVAVTYLHGLTIPTNAYLGAVYFPTQDRIYFVPFGQADQATWHYLSCNVGGVISGSTIVGYPGQASQYLGYAGGTYSANQNRLYFVPFAQANQANWCYLSDLESNVSYADDDLMAGPLFNKL